MERREARTIAIGGSVVTVALLIAFVLLPFTRRLQLRAVELEATRASIRELRALVAGATGLDSAGAAADAALGVRGRRVIRARTSALAASALQSFLQDASDASRLLVTRLDVAPADSAGGHTLPASLAAQGDIYGLADFLGHLEHGPRVVHVERMMVQINSALRGAPDMLQVTITVRAPVILE